MVLKGKVFGIVHGIGRTGFLPGPLATMLYASSVVISAGSSVFGSGQDQVPPILPDKPPGVPLPGSPISAVRLMQEGSPPQRAVAHKVRMVRFIGVIALRQRHCSP